MPIQSYWDGTAANSRCIDYDLALHTFSGAKVVTEIIILNLPMPLDGV